jgi:hypothetical protein
MAFIGFSHWAREILAVAGLGIAGCAASVTGGGSSPAGSRHVTATAAIHPHPCAASQLRLSYRGSEPGAGNDLGVIVVRDVSARACWLAGPIRLAGLDRTGRVVTMTIAYRQFQQGAGRPAAGAVLRPGFVASVPLAAEYRDDPQGWRGLCAQRHRFEPATWRVTLPSGSRMTVPNADPANTVHILTADNGLLTCRGQLDTPAPVLIARSVS